MSTRGSRQHPTASSTLHSRCRGEPPRLGLRCAGCGSGVPCRRCRGGRGAACVSRPGTPCPRTASPVQWAPPRAKPLLLDLHTPAAGLARPGALCGGGESAQPQPAAGRGGAAAAQERGRCRPNAKATQVAPPQQSRCGPAAHLQRQAPRQTHGGRPPTRPTPERPPRWRPVAARRVPELRPWRTLR